MLAQVLSLRNAGLSSLESFGLPNLLYADISSNDIRELKQVQFLLILGPIIFNYPVFL